MASLDEAIVHFKQVFLSADGKPVINEEEAEAMAEGVERKETVKRVKRPPPPEKK